MNPLNTRWHEKALQLFMFVVVAHWAEHILQAIQIYVLGWARPDAKGALGLVFPVLVTSEWLHYGYAIVMLVFLFLLRPGFTGRSHTWWTVALVIQIWHHFEHFLLLGQAQLHSNLFGSPVPTSILQLAFPRVELHLAYNAIVFVPMAIAMYYHMNPPKSEAFNPLCSCSHRPRRAAMTQTA